MNVADSRFLRHTLYQLVIAVRVARPAEVINDDKFLPDQFHQRFTLILFVRHHIPLPTGSHQLLFGIPPFFVPLHKGHIFGGYIYITVIAFLGGCVLIPKVFENQKALVDVNGAVSEIEVAPCQPCQLWGRSTAVTAVSSRQSRDASAEALLGLRQGQFYVVGDSDILLSRSSRGESLIFALII